MTQTQSAASIAPVEKERIIFEARPMMIPAILTFETLSLLGIIMVVAVASVAFHLGAMELLIIAGLWFLLAFPTFQGIFASGSTTYVLTNRRVVIFTVSLRKNEQSIPLNEIQSAQCKRSGLQGLYGAGDIVIQRKGLKKSVKLKALPKCSQLAEQITKAVKAFRS